MREVDEGQDLEVAGTPYTNCCLSLALGRAVLGCDGEKEAVHAWARWIAGLPEAQKSLSWTHECLQKHGVSAWRPRRSPSVTCVIAT